MNELCSSQESFLRLALGITFLVSVADRFGALGPYGAKNVSWGDWNHFVRYVAILNWFVPEALIPALSVLETTIETALGVALLVGSGSVLSPGAALDCCFRLLSP